MGQKKTMLLELYFWQKMMGIEKKEYREEKKGDQEQKKREEYKKRKEERDERRKKIREQWGVKPKQSEK